MQQQHAVLVLIVLVRSAWNAAYRRAEDLLIKSVHGEDASSELDSVVTFYWRVWRRSRPLPVGIAATVIGSTIQRGSRQAQTTSP